MMWTVILLLFSTAAAGKDSWLVVPGLRVGPLTTETRRADLERLFGAGEVEDSMEGPGGDAEAEPATIVHRNRPDEALTIFWVGMSPDKTKVPRTARILFVSLCGRNESGSMAVDCKWHLPQGIRLGTTLRELEALNGGAFNLYGFDWDYGGTVSDWRGGGLAALHKRCSYVGIVLSLPEEKGGATSESAKDDDAVSGDRLLVSSLPALHRISPRVTGMNVGMNTEQPCKAAHRVKLARSRLSNGSGSEVRRRAREDRYSGSPRR